MKFDQLTYFLEAARFEHIGKASRTLNISPSAISHSISSLEEELGQSLFQKHGRQILLTPHGKKLALHAQHLISEMSRIKDDLTSDSTEFEGNYRLGATHGLAAKILTPAWSELQNHNSKLKGEVYSLRSAEVVSATARRELDLGLCLSPLSHPLVTAKVLMSLPLHITMRAQHPFFKESKKISNLSKYPCVSPKAFQGIEVCGEHPELKKFGIEHKTQFIFDSYDVALQCLSETDGWALIPSIFITQNQLPKFKTFVPPGWQAKSDLAVIWPKTQPSAKVLCKLIDKIQESLQFKV